MEERRLEVEHMTPSSDVIPVVRSMLLAWTGWTPDTALLAAYRTALGRYPLDEVRAAIDEARQDEGRRKPPTPVELERAIRASRRRGLPAEIPHDPDCTRKRTADSTTWCSDGWLYEKDEGGYEVAAGTCDCKAGRARR